MGENQEKTSEKNLKETQKAIIQPVLPESPKKMGDKVVERALKNTKILGDGLPPWEDAKMPKQKSVAKKGKTIDEAIKDGTLTFDGKKRTETNGAQSKLGNGIPNKMENETGLIYPENQKQVKPKKTLGNDVPTEW